jgi:YbgC/YbaW family acyl-CoA thioester hydrolase
MARIERGERIDTRNSRRRSVVKARRRLRCAGLRCACRPRASPALPRATSDGILSGMLSEFSITRTVEFAETDMAGIMHFSNYFRWMEACESAFYRSLHLPLISFTPGQVVGWPRVNATCDFRAPLRFNDTVEVRLCVKEIRTRAVVLLFQFRKITKGKADPDICAQGEITAVCVTNDGKDGMVAAPIPDAFRAKVRVAPKAAWTSEG